MKERCVVVATLLIWAAVIAQTAIVIPTKAIGIDRYINPIPYCSQGTNPWCGVATVRMILAYTLYPQPPPSLENLAKEMGATEKKGVSGNDCFDAMRRRGIPTSSYQPSDLDFDYIRQRITWGYAVEVTVIVGKTINWFYYTVYNRVVYDYDLHAILIIGFDRSAFIYHGPDVPHGERAAMSISDSELRGKWYYAIVVERTPKETPCYTVKVQTYGVDRVVPLEVDGVKSSVWVVSFKIGEGLHSFGVPRTVMKEENKTTRIGWQCITNMKYQDMWSIGEQEITFNYVEKAWFLVKLNMPTNPDLSWERWIERYEYVPVAIKEQERVLPADSFLGQLGFKKSFVGWSVNGAVAGSDTTFYIFVTKPTEIEPIWQLNLREGNGYSLLAIYSSIVTVAVAVIFIVIRKKKTKARTMAPPFVSTEKTCVACGAKIPFDSEYCDECGAKQT